VIVASDVLVSWYRSPTAVTHSPRVNVTCVAGLVGLLNETAAGPLSSLHELVTWRARWQTVVGHASIQSQRCTR